MATLLDFAELGRIGSADHDMASVHRRLAPQGRPVDRDRPPRPPAENALRGCRTERGESSVRGRTRIDVARRPPARIAKGR
ncbi:MAG: hypothetical protein J2P19_18760 [Pseudonocardia sp.]|nr:hypothetical protein [Pseudonocardia sp.]